MICCRVIPYDVIPLRTLPARGVHVVLPPLPPLKRTGHAGTVYVGLHRQGTHDVGSRFKAEERRRDQSEVQPHLYCVCKPSLVSTGCGEAGRVCCNIRS